MAAASRTSNSSTSPAEASGPKRGGAVRRAFVQLVAVILGAFILFVLWEAIAARGPAARVRELMPTVGAQLVDEALTAEQANFELQAPPGAAGRTVRLADYPPDTIIFLNFWATWCEPCVREMPSMLDLKRRLSDPRFVMIGVSYDDGWTPVLDFFRQFVGGLPREIDLALDPTGDETASLRASFGTRKLPETYIIRNGHVFARFVNARDWVDPAMVELFQRMLESP